jgi:hypothetical protein
MSGFFNEIVKIYNINPPQQAEETPDYKKYRNIDYKTNEMGLKDIDDENNLHLYLYNNNGIKQNTGINMSIDDNTGNHEINFIVKGGNKVKIDNHGINDYDKYNYSQNDKIPSELELNNIEVWLDASRPENVIVGDNGFVYKVYDRNNKPVSQTTSTLPERFFDTIGLGVTYDNDNRMLNFNSTLLGRLDCNLSSHFSSVSSPFTLSFVIMPGISGVDGGSIFSFFNGTTESKAFKCVYNVTGTSHVLRFNGNTSSTLGVIRDDISNFVNKKIIVSIVVNSSNISNVYINGRFCGYSGVLVAERTQLLTLGRDMNIASTIKHYNGRLGEFIIHKTALSLSQILDLHNYLNNKWDVYELLPTDIFVIAGQSNAVGWSNLTGGGGFSEYGKYIDPEYIITNNPNVPETPFFTIRDPITTYTIRSNETDQTLTVAGDTSPGGSAWVEFCREYYKRTGREAFIINLAVGSTSLLNPAHWNPSNYLNNNVKKLIDVLPLLINKITKYGYIIGNKSILWHQGESDTIAPYQPTKEEYLNTFLSLHDLLISNGYDRFFYFSIADYNFPTNNTNNVIDAQLDAHFYRSTLHMVFNTRTFSRFGPSMMRADNIHYQQQAYNIMGNEAAKRIAKIYFKSQTTNLSNLIVGEKMTISGETKFNNKITTNDDIIINPGRSQEFTDQELTSIFRNIGTSIVSGSGRLLGITFIPQTNSFIAVSDNGNDSSPTPPVNRFFYSTNGTVWTSNTDAIIDNGAPPTSVYPLNDVVLGGNRLVAVFTTTTSATTDFKRFIYSDNYGLTWTTTGSTTSPTVYYAVKYLNNRFIALGRQSRVGGAAYTTRISHSTDGITWTEDVILNSGSSRIVRDAIFVNGVYLFVCDGKECYYTSDLLNFFNISVNFSGTSSTNLQSIAYSPLLSMTIITTQTTTYYYSFDFVSSPAISTIFTTSTSSLDIKWIDQLKMFVLFGAGTSNVNSGYYWSRNGINWSRSITAQSCIRFCFGNNQFVACSTQTNEIFYTEKFERNILKYNTNINNNLIINSRLRYNIQLFTKQNINISEFTTPIVILSTESNNINIYLSGNSFNEFLGLKITFIKSSASNNIVFRGPVESTSLITPTSVDPNFNSSKTYSINGANTGPFELIRIANNVLGGLWSISK